MPRLVSALVLLALVPPTVAQPNRAAPRRDCYGDPLPTGAIARLGTLRLQQPAAVALSFTSDGKIIIAAGGGHSAVNYWDVRTGRLMRRLPDEADTGVMAVSGDGHRLLYKSAGVFQVYEARFGTKLRTLKAVTPASPSALALTPDGTILEAVERKNGMQIWDLRTRTLKSHIALKNADWHVAFSHNGKMLALSEDGGRVRLNDVATGRSLWSSTVPGDQDTAPVLAFSPRDRRLAASDDRGGVYILSARTGRKMHSFSKADGEEVCALAFSPDGRTLAAGGSNGTVRLWDVKSGKPRRCDPGHDNRVTALAFSPDGKTLASGGMDQTLAVWDTRTGKARLSFTRHLGGISTLAFSPDGRMIISGSDEGGVRFWEPHTGKQVKCQELQQPVAPNGELALVPRFAFTPAGVGLAVGHGRKTICVWDVATGKQRRHWHVHSEGLRELVLTPDGAVLASASECPPLHVWDTRTGRQRWQSPVPGAGISVRALAITTDGRRLAAAGLNPTAQVIYVWDTVSGKEVGHINTPGAAVDGLVFLPDGRGLISAESRLPFLWPRQEVLRQWDVARGTETMRYAQTGIGISALALSPDGRVLAAGGVDGTIRLWEVATGGELVHLRAGHEGKVTCLAFSREHRLMALGSDDGTALVWDLTGRQAPWDTGSAHSDFKLEDSWATVAPPDARRAHDAVWQLVNAPGPTLALLRRKMQPIKPISTETMAGWAADLDDKRFAVRQAATRHLEHAADLARPVLLRLLAGPASSEAHRRARKLLRELDEPITSPVLLQGLRAVAVLEFIGTPEARTLLRRLASGLPEGRLTRQAKTALGRLIQSATP